MADVRVNEVGRACWRAAGPVRRGATALLVPLLALGLTACPDEADDVSSGPASGARPTTSTTTSGRADRPGAEPVDLPAEARPYADALAVGFVGDPDVDDDRGEPRFPLTDEQAACASSRWIDTVGADRLTGAGVDPDDLRDETGILEVLYDLGTEPAVAGELYDHLGTCGLDWAEVMTVRMVGAEASDCVADGLPDGYWRRWFVEMLTADEDHEDVLGPLLFTAAGECGVHPGP